MTTTRTYITGFPGVAIVSDVSGTVALTPGTPITTYIPDQTVASALYTDTDVVYGANVVSATTLLPLLVTDTDVFYTPTIASTSQFLSPSLVTDTDVFYTPAAATDQSLLPNVVTDLDVVYAALIAPIQTLSPSLVTDVDSYLIQGVTTSNSLLVLLWNDTDVFYAADIANVIKGKAKQELFPSRFGDSDTIYDAGIRTGTLRPGLIADADSFYAPVFTVGPVTLLPQKITDTDSFPGSSVVKVLTPALVASDDAFYAPLVEAKNDLRPNLVNDLVDTETFYTPLFTMIVRPGTMTSDDFIPIADVGWRVFMVFEDELITSEEDIFGADVYAWNELLPNTLLDEDSIETYPFFIQSITGGDVVPLPPNVLSGNVGRKKSLTGSLTPRNKKVLTGSLR